MRPDSRAPGRVPWQSAPTMCIFTSLEALPPRTERSWTSTTLPPLAGRGERGADTGKTAADHDEIRSESMVGHANRKAGNQTGSRNVDYSGAATISKAGESEAVHRPSDADRTEIGCSAANHRCAIFSAPAALGCTRSAIVSVLQSKPVAWSTASTGCATAWRRATSWARATLSSGM